MNAEIATSKPKESVRTLLSEIIDYAGLFPPSQISMSDAVINYSAYKNSNHGWMLGRFVLPVSRLDEFLESAGEFVARGASEGWRLSVLAGEDLNSTIRTIKEFNRQNAPRFVCDVLEVRANTVSKIENTLTAVPDDVTAYFEIGMNDSFADLVSTLSIREQRAKIRTGGTIPDDFPPTRDLIRFVRTCTAANVPFKATAGLHHPIRCFKPLTYAADAPKGTMHGFLNMALTAAFTRESFRVGLLEELMEEEFEEAFVFEETGIRWRADYFLNNFQLVQLRKRGFISFGSCSFDEPITDLRALGLL